VYTIFVYLANVLLHTPRRTLPAAPARHAEPPGRDAFPDQGKRDKIRFIPIHAMAVITENLVCMPTPSAEENDRGGLEVAERRVLDRKSRECKEKSGLGPRGDCFG
jgi:hypothetical protein